jgi:hypothetical protein
MTIKIKPFRPDPGAEYAAQLAADRETMAAAGSEIYRKAGGNKGRFTSLYRQKLEKDPSFRELALRLMLSDMANEVIAEETALCQLAADAIEQHGVNDAHGIFTDKVRARFKSKDGGSLDDHMKHGQAIWQHVLTCLSAEAA